MIELKFHTAGFEELALQEKEPKKSLEKLLKQYENACKEYQQYMAAKEKAEAPWRRTRINSQGEEETYIDYEARENADSRECWDYAFGEFNGYEYIEMLEHTIDVKICHMNRRESR